MYPGEDPDLTEHSRTLHRYIPKSRLDLHSELITKHVPDLASSSSELQNSAFDAVSQICMSSHCTVRCR